MSLSLGVMLRLDYTPPAVAVPVLLPSVQAGAPVIEAEKVVATASLVREAAVRGGSAHAGRAFSAQQLSVVTPLTYSRQGGAGLSSASLHGQRLNLYA